MDNQDVFKGALGWDDWIWWSGIGGLGLFFLMVILCCIVCVQRAKRKGRDEAMAVIHARERERQQQEQAQLRYAQAQQVRYPAREPSYKFSKPEQATYNPFGHDDHHMHRNAFAQPPAPRPTPRRGPQLPPPVVEANDQQQQQQQALYPIPQRDEQPPAPPQELPQVAAYYGRTPQQNDTIPTAPAAASPTMSEQYQRQQQVNPAQPSIMQYRRRSSTPHRSDNGSVRHDDAMEHTSEVSFVQVNSPRNSNVSTASTTYSVAATSTSMPVASTMSYNNNSHSRPIATSVATSHGRPSMSGGTLRDRIDALREGAPQDNVVRISMSSLSSGAPSTVSSPPTKPPPPPRYSSAPPAPPARVSQLMTATVLSDSSYGTDDGAFDEDAFGTARSAHVAQLVQEDSEGSVGSGQFDDPATPPHDRRNRTGDSTGSSEF